MKRIGQLIEAIAASDNLRLAFWKAAKGKRTKADCVLFQERLDGNLEKLGAELLSGQVPVGDYHYFTIHDPKERTICAASFRERVLHHALMNVCEPALERAAIFDSYACRRGKGRLLAVARAQEFARRHRWFLKLELKGNTAINRTVFGMDFLGYRLFPGTVRLARRSKVRFARKFRRFEQTYQRGQWTELHLQQRMQALLAFVLLADSQGYRRHVFERFGVVAQGLEPGDPRWQLEQQRQELPGHEPQQQLAGQPEQQRIPLRPARSSTAALDEATADPAAILS